jgi:uncharacterized protein YcbK (DUF882 family)
MKLTTNFSLSEFNKRNYNVPTDVLRNLIELAKNLQVLRDEVKKPIKITSGYRPAELNAKVGGVTKSRHITGEAADFKIEGYTPKQVAAIIEKLIAAGKMKQGGLGTYSTWVHYDTYFNGKNPRRWSK